MLKTEDVPAESGGTHRDTRIVFAARAGFLVTVLCLAIATITLVPFRLLAEWPTGIVEPSVLVGIERVLRGEVLYRPYWETIPLVPLPYGAAEYLVPGVIARWSGLSDPMALIRIGRILSLVAFVVSAFLCMAIARNLGASRGWAVAAAGGLFAVPAAMEWTTKLAPDMPALTFSLLGWYFARQLLQPGRLPGKAVSGFLLSAASWTIAFHFKPTVIAGPLALSFELFHLFLTGKRPWWAVACAATALLTSVSVAITLQVVSGGLYWANVGGSMAVCRYSLGNLAQTAFLVVPNGIVLTGLLCLLVLRSPSHFLWRAALANLTVELLLATKQGSNVNYFLGTLALSGIAMAVWEGTRRQAGTSPVRQLHWRSFATYAAHGILLCGLVLQIPGSMAFSRELPIPDPGEIAAVDRAVAEVADKNRVLCLDPFYARTRGLNCPFADSYHANLLLSAGFGDVSALVDRVRRRDVPLIVGNKLVAWKFSPHGAALVYPPLREAILRNYHPVRVGGWLIVFAPDPAP